MITSPGIGSGLDIESLVSQLVTLEGQAPAERLARREGGFQAELSGLGTFRASLDGLRSALAVLKDPTQFNTRTASSSNEDLFTVSVENNVAPGDYDIEVLSLARVHKLSSAVYADAETFVGDGTLEFTLDPGGENPTTISIEIPEPEDPTFEDPTLAQVRDAINSADNNPGVVASIINAEDGAYLILNGTETGAANSFSVTATGDAALVALAAGLTEQQVAADAEITIDGFTHLSTTDTITGAIDGMTIELQGAEPGETAVLSVSRDVTTARDMVEAFVDAYNSLITTTNELTRYNSETGETGLLQGRSIVTSLLNRLYQEFNETMSGPLNSIRDLGMSITVDGKIELDDAALESVLNSSFEDVGDMFSNVTDGAAVRFDALLDDYLKFGGLMDSREDGLEASIATVEEDREQLNIRLAAVESRLRTQFLALDQLVAELNGTSGFLSTQLNNLLSPSVLLGGS